MSNKIAKNFDEFFAIIYYISNLGVTLIVINFLFLRTLP